MARFDSLWELIAGGAKQAPVDPVTGTVSKLDEAVMNMRQNKMQANQIENALMGMNAGVKRAEIQDTGLDRWLAEQGGSVTQRDIAEYLDQAREPIGVTRYQTEKYPPLESLPPMQHSFQRDPEAAARLSVSHGLGTKGDLKSNDPAVFEPAAQDYRDWVVSRGGTPSRANYILEKYRNAGMVMNDLPDEAWGSGQFSILDFAKDRGYHQMAFEKPYMELDFTDPTSGRRYQVEPTADRSMYRTYEHTGNERKPLTVNLPPPDANGNPLPFNDIRAPLSMDEALQAINARRIEGSDTTRYSHMTDPGLDPGTYKEDVITLPGRGPAENPMSYAHDHWENVENPMIHLRSSHRELDDGSFAVHVEELQSDWHQKADKLGGAYWSPENKEAAIDASEKANRKLTDLVSKGNFETSDVDMVDGFDSVVDYVNEFGDEYRLATLQVGDGGKSFIVSDERIKKAFPNGAPDNIKELLEDAANKQIDVRNVRNAPPDAPMKKGEWQKFGIKQAIRRAIDEGASGITLPSGDDMIMKEGVMGDARIENGLRRNYDQKLPSVLKDIGKQYGVKPEMRKMYYGDEEVERLYLPLTDEMIEKIKTEGMKKYGKTEQPQGILDAIGDMYA
jgi:hypothetical protein